MKTIKVFIASSDELHEERVYLARVFSQINREIKSLYYRFEPVKWEYLDASMGIMHKQDEYNEELQTCEVCLILFWRRFGEYTQEELNVAYKGFLLGSNPRRLYVYFKESMDIVSPELQTFKNTFDEVYNHTYFRFFTLEELGSQVRMHLLDYIRGYTI